MPIYISTNLLQLRGHDDKTLDGLSYVRDGLAHHGRQTVVADQLLAEHSVHGLFIADRVLLVDDLQVVVGWQLGQNVRGQLVSSFGGRFARARRGLTWQRQQNRAEQHVGLLVVLGDVGILVQAIDFGKWIAWQRLDVWNKL